MRHTGELHGERQFLTKAHTEKEKEAHRHPGGDTLPYTGTPRERLQHTQGE